MRNGRILFLAGLTIFLMGCVLSGFFSDDQSRNGDASSTPEQATQPVLPTPSAEETPSSGETDVNPEPDVTEDYPPLLDITGTPGIKVTFEVPPPLDFPMQLLPDQPVMLPIGGYEVQLQDGAYKGTLPNGDSVEARLTGMFAQGDLNGDGMQDGAAILSENFGGTGTFVSILVFVNENGHIRQAGSAYIDDRPRIARLKIENQELLLTGIIHRSDDAMVSPSMAIEDRYRLFEDEVVLVNRASGDVGKIQHRIEMDAPRWGDTVNEVVELHGFMPSAPFENNLRLRVLDAQGNEVYVEGYTVQFDEPTFSAQIETPVDVSFIPGGEPFWLDLADISAKDGSVLASHTIHLIRK